MITTHVPNSIMFVLLYVQSLMWFFMDFLSCSTVTFLNNFLNIYSGIMLLSLPVSYLYGISTMLLHACVSKCAVITNWLLFKCTKSILTVSTSSSWDSCSVLTSTSSTTWSHLLLHTFLKWPISPHPVHVFPYAGHCWGTWISLQYLHSHLWDIAFVFCLILLLFGFWATLILSNWHNSVISFNMAACGCCTPTLLALTNTPSLVFCLSLLLAVSSLITSSNITLSFNLWTNCSFSCRSFSL